MESFKNFIISMQFLRMIIFLLVLLFFSFVFSAENAFSQTVIAPVDKIGHSEYASMKPLVPIKKISTGGVIHRFHDTSPLSPSGKYMALFRVPFEDHYPEAGDAGEVILVDMKSGEEKFISKSFGWEMQVGANVQWGANDQELFFNNVDTATWEAFTVLYNPSSGRSKRIGGPAFMVSLDGKKLVSHNLINSVHAQSGYGVIIPDSLTAYNIGPVDTDGIFVSETETGKTTMITSIKDIYEKTVPSIKVPNPNDYYYYCFKAMWNPQGSRIMTTVMMKPLSGGKRRLALITMLPDGSDIRTAITLDQYSKGGHHMAWLPDGDHISMNLNVDGKPGIELITVKYDGTELKEVYPVGSGHPSFHPGGLPFVITDSYWQEPVTKQDGFVPIRLINVETGTEDVIAMVYVPIKDDSSFRVDAHPTWDRSGRYIIFNAFEDNTRCVFMADLKSIVDTFNQNNHH